MEHESEQLSIFETSDTADLLRFVSELVGGDRSIPDRIEIRTVGGSEVTVRVYEREADDFDGYYGVME